LAALSSEEKLEQRFSGWEGRGNQRPTMRYRKALLPTLKEAPADATATSHVLLTRAGCTRQVGAGLYSFLPLGLKVLRKIEAIVREEMGRAGAQELLLPALLPAEYFKETGRWDVFGDTLFRLKDRRNADYHLAPTHEEIITDLARREIQTYRDLPQNLYQIQMKFRDEPRPRGGLLRGREFIMKDAYSFDETEEGALQSFQIMEDAYKRIFDRLGFNYRLVGADSGAMGGSKSTEFQVLVQSGEDLIAACPNCAYAENLEVAKVTAQKSAELSAVAPREEVATPDQKSIAAVAQFLKVAVDTTLKSLVYKADDAMVMVVVRGDHEVNEISVARVTGARDVRLASAAEVKEQTGVAPGSVGPVGYTGRVLVDVEAANVQDATCGALKEGYHLVHVQQGRDFDAEVHSLRVMVEGDPCPKCGAHVKIYRGIEAGHIFVLGTHYSEKMGATFLDKNGEKKPLVMGCYGIGISRLVASLVEQHHDEAGIRWPLSVAPYPVHICALGNEEEVETVVTELETKLLAAGFEPLVDDRDVRPGVKFKDADLIGLPFRITVGGRGLKEGIVEFKARSESDPKASERLPIAEAAAIVIERITAELVSS
jgi:prolyl-tRNA synthetase